MCGSYMITKSTQVPWFILHEVAVRSVLYGSFRCSVQFSYQFKQNHWTVFLQSMSSTKREKVDQIVIRSLHLKSISPCTTQLQ